MVIIILLLILFLNAPIANATVPVMRFPSGTTVSVCVPSDSNSNCGGTSIGGTVSGSSANEVLYTNSSNKLAQSSNLIFDGNNLTVAGQFSALNGDFQIQNAFSNTWFYIQPVINGQAASVVFNDPVSGQDWIVGNNGYNNSSGKGTWNIVDSSNGYSSPLEIINLTVATSSTQSGEVTIINGGNAGLNDLLNLNGSQDFTSSFQVHGDVNTNQNIVLSNTGSGDGGIYLYDGIDYNINIGDDSGSYPVQLNEGGLGWSGGGLNFGENGQLGLNCSPGSGYYQICVNNAFGSTYPDIGNPSTNSWNILPTGVYTGTSYVVTGGASSQFLKANGTLDSTTYASTSSPTIATPSFTTSESINNSGTSKNCATSGTVTWYPVEQGSGFKKVIGYANACLGASASYTFPTAFSHTPAVLTTNELVSTLLSTLSTTTVVMTGTTSTGYIFIEGN